MKPGPLSLSQQKSQSQRRWQLRAKGGETAAGKGHEDRGISMCKVSEVLKELGLMKTRRTAGVPPQLQREKGLQIKHRESPWNWEPE